jgi:hypothetical protein
MDAALQDEIYREIINPDLRRQFRDLATWRHRWRKISKWCEGVAHLLLGAASILAFSAGFFDSFSLSYSSACCSTTCVALLRFAAYAAGEATERDTELAQLALNNFGVAPGNKAPAKPNEPADRPLPNSSPPALYSSSLPAASADQLPSLAAGQLPSLAAGQLPSLAASQTPSLAADQTPSLAAGQTPSLAAGQTPSFAAAGQTPSFAAAGRTPSFAAAGRTPSRTAGQLP